MIDILLNYFLLLKYPIFFLSLSFVVLAFRWKVIFQYLHLKPYKNIQRVHNDEVSRLGGFLIYLFLWVIYFLDYVEVDIFFNILTASLPFVIISLKEDLFHNTKPSTRLLSMLLSCIIFFIMHPTQFPMVDLPLIGPFLNLFPLNYIFFSFSIIVLMNGMNLIDGMNGLFSFSALTQIFLLIFLSLITNLSSYSYLYLFIIPLLVFLLFNFPFAKIFIGDLGAYFYGFIIAVSVIDIFGQNVNLLSWLAVLIVFYPAYELLFSFVRKAKLNKSPFYPDNMHLHTILFRLLCLYNIKYNQLNNSLTTLTLSIFWLFPQVMIIFIYNSINYILFILIVFVFFYCLSYKLLSSLEKRS